MVVGPITLSGLNGQNVQKAVETVCKKVPIVGHEERQEHIQRKTRRQYTYH
jgi:hypothetical protein